MAIAIRRFRACGLSTMLCLLASPAVAQPAAPPAHTQIRAAVAPGGGIARLATTWSARAEDNRATISLAGDGSIVLHRGSAVVGSLAVGHGRVLVALATGEGFRVWAPRADGGELAVGSPIDVRRAGRPHLPFAVAVTPVPDGFAVFFQEVEERDPTAAHTHLVRLDPDGTPKDAARELPIPWSLAAAAWNGRGFHLALLYPGGGDGMRLSMVSVDESGAPQQHPDWASEAGFVSDVHLVARGERIVAFYRGGTGGDRLLERDVTTIRQWGTEPPRAREHGPLSSDAAIALEPGPGPPRVIR